MADIGVAYCTNTYTTKKHSGLCKSQRQFLGVTDCDIGHSSEYSAYRRD